MAVQCSRHDREVLYLDSDDMPIVDPSFLFDLKLYKQTGAMFWPDFCNYHTTRHELWDVMGLKRPKHWPDTFLTKLNATDQWTRNCDPNENFEFETGQIVVDKKAAWRGLMMTAFINRHHTYFLEKLMKGDKQTFEFGFNATNTPFTFVKKHPFGLGLQGQLPKGDTVFCSNTMGQRHPVTGELLFLHRNNNKLNQAFDFFKDGMSFRAWTHISKQARHSVYLCNFT